MDVCVAATVTGSGAAAGGGDDDTGVGVGATVRRIAAGVAPTVVAVVYRNRIALAATVTASAATTIET